MLIPLCSCWPVSFGRVNGKRELPAVRRLKNVGKVWKDGHMIHKIRKNGWPEKGKTDYNGRWNSWNHQGLTRKSRRKSWRTRLASCNTEKVWKVFLCVQKKSCTFCHVFVVPK